MALRLYPVTGRFVFSDDTASGAVVWDTDEAMLAVKPADVEIGSQVVPERSASSSGVNGAQTVVDISVDYLLGIIELPGAKIVRGMMSTTWTSDPQPPDGFLRQASGTHIDIYDAVGQTGVPQDDTKGTYGNQRVAQLGLYTLYVNPLNHLVLNERLVIRARDSGNPPDNIARARRQCTVDYRLLVGFFFQQSFALPPAVLPPTGTKQQGINTTVFTFSGGLAVPIGYAFTGRRVVLSIHGMWVNGNAASVPTSVTINGSAATIHGGVAQGQVSTAIVSAIVDAGTDATVVVTFPSAVRRCQVTAHAAGNITNATPTVSTQTGSGVASVSLSLTVNAAFALVASAFTSNSGGSTQGWEPTWSGAVQASSAPIEDVGFSSAIVAGGAGLVTAQVTWPTTGSHAMVAAVWT